MARKVETRPDWLPDEFEHVELTREEVRQALDREARRLFNLAADEFLAICQDPSVVILPSMCG